MNIRCRNPVAVPFKTHQKSVIRCLTVNTEQPNDRVTTFRDPTADANRVIYPA
jgi:hypothetical protein